MNNGQIPNNKVGTANSHNSNLNRAQQQSQLGKDADVYNKNKGLDSKRDYGSGLKSSNTSDGSSSNSLSKSILNNKQNITNSSVNNLKKGASSVAQGPSRLAGAIQNAKAKKISLIPKPSTQEINSAEQMEEAQDAARQGRTYNEDNVGGKATFKLDKKTKIALAAFIFGTMGIFVFLGIMVMSAMTTTAGKTYLESKFESKEEVTEEELTNSYEEKQNAES